MHFSKYTFAVAALCYTVLAQGVRVHVVQVSGTGNKLTFSPNKLTAAAGEMVQFQFGAGNHTVTQSSFDAPCVPIAGDTTGFHSGFMPVSGNAKNIPTYTIPITSTTPMWLYCAQGKHCQNGMVMAINEITTKNASRSLENYTIGAKAAPSNIAPSGGVSNGGTLGETPSSSWGLGSGAANTTSGNGAGIIYAPHLAGLLAVGAALLI